MRFNSFGAAFHSFFLALLFVAAMRPSTLQARPPEPGTMDPLKDAAYVATLGLAANDWSDPIINLLVVGQDARGGYHRTVRYKRPDGTSVPDLGSRSDGNLLISFNKLTGQISIMALYRGMTVGDTFWNGVEDAPPPSGVATDGTPLLGERYLANYYLIAGRAKYVAFLRNQIESFVTQKKLETQYFTGRGLKIHGLVETGFGGFKRAMDQFTMYFRSSAKVAYAMRSHAGAFIEIIINKDKLMSELTVQDITPTPGMSEATLRALRAREIYRAGGYQRSFNHAKFFTSVMGFFAFAMAEAGFTDILSEPAITTAFNIFSRTFDLQVFDQHLRLPDRGLHIISRTGFQNGHSPVYVIQLGTTVSSYAIYQGGDFKVTPRAGLVSQIDPKIELIPKANDCPACLPK